MAEKNWYDNLDDAVDVSTTEPERTRSIGDFAIDTGRSFAQGLTFAQADEAEALARALYLKFAEGKDFNTAYDEILKSVRKDIKEFREDEPFVAYPAEIAGSIPSAIGAGARLANLGIKGLKNIATQSGLYGFGASEGKDPVDRLPETVVSTAIGTTLGKALPPVTEKAKELIKQGVPLTIGQSVGGGLRKLEESFKSLPFLGDPIIEAEVRAVKGFNKAVFEKVLEPLKKYGLDTKKELKGVLNGNQLYAKSSDIIEKGYDDLVPNLKFPNLKDLQPIYDDIILNQAEFMPSKINNSYLRDMDEIVYANFGADGVLTGQGFKKIQSGLRRKMKSLSKSTSEIERGYARSYADVLDGLSDTLKKNNPDFAKKLNDLDFSFKMLNLVGNAVEKGTKKEGTFTSSNLLDAVKAGDASLRRKDLRKGEALFQDIGNLGTTLNVTLPDSGTATRLGLNSLFTTGGFGGGAIYAGADPLTTGLLTGGLLSGYSRVGVPTVRDYIYGMGLPSARNVTSGLLSSNVTPEMNIGR